MKFFILKMKILNNEGLRIFILRIKIFILFRTTLFYLELLLINISYNFNKFIVFLTATYRSRNRRELTFASEVPESFDAQEVEKYIIGEFGARACIFERVCAHYATRARQQPKPQMDWPQVFR